MTPTKKIAFTIDILEKQLEYLTVSGSEDQFLIDKTIELIAYLKKK